MSVTWKPAYRESLLDQGWGPQGYKDPVRQPCLEVMNGLQWDEGDHGLPLSRMTSTMPAQGKGTHKLYRENAPNTTKKPPESITIKTHLCLCMCLCKYIFSCLSTPQIASNVSQEYYTFHINILLWFSPTCFPCTALVQESHLCWALALQLVVLNVLEDTTTRTGFASLRSTPGFLLLHYFYHVEVEEMDKCYRNFFSFQHCTKLVRWALLGQWEAFPVAFINPSSQWQS